MQLHTVAHVLMIQRKYLLSVEKNGERTKCILFFSSKRTSFQDDLLWLWIPPSPPPPSCSVWRQIHWFPVSQWTCKGHFLYEREREENPLHFLSFFCCAWFAQPLQNGSSVIVLCSWEMIWILCRPEWEKMSFGLSVCVWSETRDFTASSVFMWITGIAVPLF